MKTLDTSRSANERELPIDDLDQVSGGVVIAIIAILIG